MKHTISRWIMVVVVFMVVLSTSVFFYSLYLLSHKPFYTQTLEVNFTLTDRIGMDASTEGLTFGGVLPGTVLTRSIYLENSYDFPLGVSIYISDSMAPFISTQFSSIRLAPGARERIYFTLNPPAGTPLGEYSGMLTFVFHK